MGRVVSLSTVMVNAQERMVHSGYVFFYPYHLHRGAHIGGTHASVVVTDLSHAVFIHY